MRFRITERVPPTMIAKQDYRKVQDQLQAFLGEQFEEVSVQIGDGIHYRGTNVVVTSPRFKGLLPEQRFYLVARAIPTDFYEQHLRGGCVWFELAPGETGKDLMKMPRSGDIVAEEAAIGERLAKIGFFKKLQSALRASKSVPSDVDFPQSRQVLSKAGLGEAEITRACLFFILHGGYSDAQVLTKVMAESDDEE